MRFSPWQLCLQTVASSDTPSEVALSTNPVLLVALVLFFLLYDLMVSEMILFGYVFAPVPVTRAVNCIAKVGIRQVT